MKYIFFDVDGTLTNSNPGGVVLESTKQTLKKLEENGHFIAIATGRAHWMALSACEMTGIYNLVHDGGNGITINGEVQYIHPLDKEKALKIIDELLTTDLYFDVVIDDTPNHYTHLDASHKKVNWVINTVEDLDYHTIGDIYKIFIDMKEEDEAKVPSLNLLSHMRYLKEEVIVEPDDKYKGILDLVTRLGGSEDDIVVFGDGHNDLSMFKHAKTSIAMGNAIDELKEIATYVTKPNTENGIEHACLHFGWINHES